MAMFLDYENLAIGARDSLNGMSFDIKPISDALAERGRVVVRRAYADWSMFDEDRRHLTRNHVELIEIPQRMGASRKNAADIKMAVDALELAFERQYVTTFVICTGDSDFTPLVHKLRELNKRVIGVGVKQSTSKLLPPACDEFLFYERLEGIDVPERSARRRPRRDSSPKPDREKERDKAADEPAAVDEDVDRSVEALSITIAQTVAGMQSSGGPVLASGVKRALLRKDPTFSEADYGFRGFGELLDHVADRGVVQLSQGPAKGDPEVSLSEHGGEDEAFALLQRVVAEAEAKGGPPVLSGLKNRLRKEQPDFSEKKFGYGGFLQFCKAAANRGMIDLEWSDDAEDYVLAAP